MTSQIKEKIDHVVVLMLENRSFDNLLGWLYTNEISPDHVIPPATRTPTAYRGLDGADYSNPMNLHEPGDKVPVQKGVSSFTVPTPDPNEDFKYMNRQQFGLDIDKNTDGWLPPDKAVPGMQGFLADYLSVHGVTAESGKQIMQTYTTEDLSVMSDLARGFAVSDNYHAASPTQTWPNRAFMHAGTSLGHVNNVPYLPYDTPTLFNLLEAKGKSWKVYKSSVILPSLTRIQMLQLWDPLLDGHFEHVGDFYEDCKNDTLPAYSFIEPHFASEPPDSLATDEHPPANVCMGDHFLAEVWNAIVQSPAYERILFIVNFDEHGGCADHVPPNWTAVPPDSDSTPGDEGFGFNRYGVRVPCIVTSPYIEAGTVFRATDDPWSETSVPYDHTSVIAMIMDWCDIARDKLPSKRVQSQPMHPFDQLLTRDKPRTDRPVYQAACPMPKLGCWDKFVAWLEKLLGYGPYHQPLGSLQTSIVIADAHWRAAKASGYQPGVMAEQAEVDHLLATINTAGKMADHFRKLYS